MVEIDAILYARIAEREMEEQEIIKTLPESTLPALYREQADKAKKALFTFQKAQEKGKWIE